MLKLDRPVSRQFRVSGCQNDGSFRIARLDLLSEFETAAAIAYATEVHGTHGQVNL
jgi:hypothetical protein